MLSFVKSLTCYMFPLVINVWICFESLFSEEELQADDDDDDDEGGGEQHQAAKQLRGPGTSVIESGDVGVLFLEELDQVLNPIERTDFTNFRGLLWRAMSQFPERVEPRSRELSPLLLRFIRCVWALSHQPICLSRKFSITEFSLWSLCSQ